MDLMKLTRSIEIDGVTLHMLPYNTPLSKRFSKLMREAFGIPVGDGRMKLDNDVASYVLGAPLTIRIDLPKKDAPDWAIVAKDFISDRSFLADPVAGWEHLSASAPEILFDKWYQAWEGTRPKEIEASPQLKDPMPDATDQDGEPNPTTENEPSS